MNRQLHVQIGCKLGIRNRKDELEASKAKQSAPIDADVYVSVFLSALQLAAHPTVTSCLFDVHHEANAINAVRILPHPQRKMRPVPHLSFIGHGVNA